MFVRILGSAAGGGLPQWNCNCANCAAVRAGSPEVQPRTQSSVAVSADGESWFLLNVSPDVRQQVAAASALGPPKECRRGTAIAGCVLTDAEIDHTTGLLILREGELFPICATRAVRNVLNEEFPIATMLSAFCDRSWREIPLNESFELWAGASSLHVRAFDLPGDPPRFSRAGPQSGDTIGLLITDPRTGGRLLYAPCVGRINEAFVQFAKTADCVLMDGTFWSNDELIRLGLGHRSAWELGHWPIGDADGSLNWLAGLPIRHRVYLHINNTNPILRQNSAEWRRVEQAGVQVGRDHDCFEL